MFSLKKDLSFSIPRVFFHDNQYYFFTRHRMTSSAMRIAPMSRTCLIVWENARLMKNLLLSVFDDLKSLGKRYHVQRPKSMERMTLVSIKMQEFLCSLQNNICIFCIFTNTCRRQNAQVRRFFQRKKRTPSLV